jgi:sialate O-acetylesterase
MLAPPMSAARRLAWGALAVVTAATGEVRAAPRLAALFGDHMVLQQGRPLPVWGTAEPGEAITVAIADQTRSATAGKDGRWRVELAPLASRAPLTLVVKGKGTITLTDVLVGEVWVASGQSNMEWPLVAAERGESETLAASLPTLRLFQVVKPAVEKLGAPPADVEGTWTAATPETAALFSAVGYFFGRELARQLGRPVGIIHTSWGGTPAEAWTSREAMLANPALKHLVIGQPRPPTTEATRAWDKALATWRNQQGSRDRTNQGFAAGWARPDCPELGWGVFVAPALWRDIAAPVPEGAIWLRREVELPSAFRGEALSLRLGAIEECDTTYVNGVQIGATCREQPSLGRWPRAYRVPREITRTGRLLVAVRVVDGHGWGGLLGPRESLRLVLGDAPDGPSLPLAGEWSFKVEPPPLAGASPAAPRPPPPPGTPTASSPGVLFQSMVAPLIPFGIRGTVWYQGESNTKRAYQYRTLLPVLIQDWRKRWGQGTFPSSSCSWRTTTRAGRAPASAARTSGPSCARRRR